MLFTDGVQKPCAVIIQRYSWTTLSWCTQ